MAFYVKNNRVRKLNPTTDKNKLYKIYYPKIVFMQLKDKKGKIVTYPDFKRAKNFSDKMNSKSRSIRLKTFVSAKR